MSDLHAFTGRVKVYVQPAFAVNWYDVYVGPYRVASIGRNPDTGRYFRPNTSRWYDSLEYALKDFAEDIAIDIERETA